MQLNQNEILSRLDKLYAFVMKEMETVRSATQSYLELGLDMSERALDDLKSSEYMARAEIMMRPHIASFWPYHSIWLIFLGTWIMLLIPMLCFRLFRRPARTEAIEEEQTDTIEIEEIKEDERQAPATVRSVASPIKPRRSTRARKEPERFDPTHVKTPRKQRAVGA